MPLFRRANVYDGVISVNHRNYFISAEVSPLEEWNSESLTVDYRLRNLLGESLINFISDNLDEEFPNFFANLENLVKTLLHSDQEPDLWNYKPLQACKIYKHLEEELSKIEHYVKDINAEEGIIQIQKVDSAFRTHKAVLKINQNYPRDPVKILTLDLPVVDDNLMNDNISFKSIRTITEFCEKFAKSIDLFQDFWNIVAILDERCWILDPENPSFKDITRRVKISDRISVVLLFNPYQGQNRPEIKFLGCHSSVADLRNVFQKNLKEDIWDPEGNILDNLMNVLEVNFPPKSTAVEVDSLNLVQAGECAICFLVRYENEIPSVICDNDACLSNYHSNCLFKYLSSVPGNKNFFGKIQGECPNCESVIFCQIPNFN